MKKISRRSFLTVCGAAAAAAALTACGGSASSASGTAASASTTASSAAGQAAGTLSGNVATGGSTSMKNVIAALTEGFAEVEPGVTVSYDPTGSGAGITGATDKTLDIGLSSRALKDDEKNDVDGTTVALDGIAIIINADSKVADLTVQQIADIFTETALQEKEHAKRLFKFLEGGAVEITATFPAGVIGSTLDNLKAAAAGENEEHSDMYPSFAKVADEEGFPVIAAVMRNIAVAEQHHEQRFLAFAAAIEAGTVFKSDKPRVWRCQNCGYVHEGLEAPESCPACAHPREYFQAL